MKVAVIGASGFVGRHVIDQLRQRGIDTVATFTAPREPLLAEARGVRWQVLDIARPPVECLAALGHPDIVIHLAWAGLPNYKSLHHVETELPAQYSFLRQLVGEGLRSLVVTGTCFEYGFQYGPLSASAPTFPANPYALAKDTLRRQLQLLQSQQPFDLTWARLFYMYGEGQPETSLLPSLRRAVAQGRTEFDMSHGEQLRDYLPVAEVARRLVGLALDRPDRGVVNVCSGEPVSVRRLVEGWLRENGWAIELRLGRYPYPDYEPLAFWGVDSSA